MSADQGVPTGPEERVDALLTDMARSADAIDWRASGADVRSMRGVHHPLTRRAAVVAFAAALVTFLVITVPDRGRPGSTTRTTASAGSQPGTGGSPRVVVAVPAGAGAYAIAVSGGTLYTATDDAGEPPYALSAYSLASDRLIRRVDVPSMPAALRIGPASRVWLSFYADQAGGPSATWLFSADLAARSVEDGNAPTEIVPIGPDSAVYVTQSGLDRLDMPVPGQPGRATTHPEPDSSIGPSLSTAPGYTALTLDNRVVVQVTNGYGAQSHLVVAGEPAVTFGGTQRTQVGYAAAVGNDMWVTTTTSGGHGGPLVELRLDRSFIVVTPASIAANPALSQSEQVWSDGRTVFVATTSPGHGLVCFSDGADVGPVYTVPVDGQPVALAATADMVYVATAASNALATSDVVGFPVPAGCR